MAVPQTLPAVTGQSQISNRWMVEVDTASSETAPAWTPVFGRKSYGAQINPTTVDNSDSDTGAWTSQFAVGFGWTATLVVEHKLYNGDEDEGQAFLRTAAAPTGPNAQAKRVHIRWYDIFGGEEVFEGWATVQWAGSTAERDSDKATVTFTGQGALYGQGDTVQGSPLANPIASNVAPTVTSASPSGAAQGTHVTILGSNFNGATQVKFGATNATAYTIASNGKIVASMPAGSAGTANITVVNATGTSNSLSYTRGA